MPKQSYKQQEARLLKGQPQTSMERYAAYLLNPDEDHHSLTDEELKHLNKLDKVDNLIRSYGRMLDVISFVCKLDGEDKPMSRYRAEHLIREAQDLFGSVNTINKPYWRTVLLEKAMEVFNLAIKANDFSAAGNALMHAAKFLRLDQADDTEVAETTATTYVMVIKAGDKQTSLDLTNIGYLSAKHRNELVQAAQEQAMDIEWEEIEKGTLPPAASNDHQAPSP